MVHFLVQVSPELEEPRPVIASHRPRSEELSSRARGLGAPDLELEEAVARGAVSLGEEEIVLRLRVDVGDAPHVLDDLHALLQTGQGQGLAALRPHRLY